MARYHIGENGPGVCSAQVRPCPYGGESGNERHYDSLGAAEMAFALDMGGSFSPVAKKSPFRAQDEVRRGLGTDAEANQDLKNLDEDARAFWGSKTEDEKYLLDYYKMNGYVGMKALQVGGYYREGWERSFLHRYPDEEQRQEVLRDYETGNRRLADLYKRHGEADKPRTLYRLQNVQEFSPDGSLTTDEYLGSLQAGDSFEFKSWASTSADSDFVLASGEKTREFHPDRQIVIFEMVTKRGMPLHNPDDHQDAVQSREREVLLAPGERYRVVGVQRDVLYQEAKELSIGEQLGGMSRNQGRYHVVQLEEVATPRPAAAAPPPSPAVKSPSPQERMMNARKALQKHMVDSRTGGQASRSEDAAEIFDKAQHEISRIRSKTDAERLSAHYAKQHVDAHLNTRSQDVRGQAVVAAYRDVAAVLREMMGS